MKNIKFPVLLTTFYLLVYVFLHAVGAGIKVMIVLFAISQFMVVWMVIRVLKDGEPSGRKFDDGYWYDDSDYKGIAE